MGKKMGINSKALEARERKDTQKRAKNEAAERRKEDEFWRDDDKHVNRKMDRQRERESKAQEERDRKAANKAAYQAEMEATEQSVRSSRASAKHQQLAAEPKVTRFEIQRQSAEEEQRLAATGSKQLRKVNVAPIALTPNLNRVEGENASTIEQALDLLNPNKSSSVETSALNAASKARK